MNERKRAQPHVVFLLDVDNTLLDNDRLKEDLNSALEGAIGPDLRALFWSIYEEVRAEQDYVDYPTTIERFRERAGDEPAGTVDTILAHIPFRSYVYEGVFATIDYLSSLGTPVILSDGDQVFQRRKIELSGLAAAVGARVLIYVHKEEHLSEVFQLYPADHYVAVDDKPRILSALEEECPTTFTTVLVLQGKYSSEGKYSPPPDLVVTHIAELQQFPLSTFLDPDTARSLQR